MKFGLSYSRGFCSALSETAPLVKMIVECGINRLSSNAIDDNDDDHEQNGAATAKKIRICQNDIQQSCFFTVSYHATDHAIQNRRFFSIATKVANTVLVGINVCACLGGKGVGVADLTANGTNIFVGIIFPTIGCFAEKCVFIFGYLSPTNHVRWKER